MQAHAAVLPTAIADDLPEWPIDVEYIRVFVRRFVPVRRSNRKRHGRPLSDRHPAQFHIARGQSGEICRHRSEEHTSELQSLMRNSYAVFCLKKKNQMQHDKKKTTHIDTRSQNINYRSKHRHILNHKTMKTHYSKR